MENTNISLVEWITQSIPQNYHTQEHFMVADGFQKLILDNIDNLLKKINKSYDYSISYDFAQISQNDILIVINWIVIDEILGSDQIGETDITLNLNTLGLQTNCFIKVDGALTHITPLDYAEFHAVVSGMSSRIDNLASGIIKKIISPSPTNNQFQRQSGFNQPQSMNVQSQAPIMKMPMPSIPTSLPSNNFQNIPAPQAINQQKSYPQQSNQMQPIQQHSNNVLQKGFNYPSSPQASLPPMFSNPSLRQQSQNNGSSPSIGGQQIMPNPQGNDEANEKVVEIEPGQPSANVNVLNGGAEANANKIVLPKIPKIPSMNPSSMTSSRLPTKIDDNKK